MTDSWVFSIGIETPSQILHKLNSLGEERPYQRGAANQIQTQRICSYHKTEAGCRDQGEEWRLPRAPASSSWVP
jgi:hypothetical protein